MAATVSKAQGPATTLKPTVLWTPLPKQALALACPVDEVLFGGAVGGGKTDFLLAKWVQHAERYGDAARGLIARKTMPELREILKRAHKMFPLLGAEWRASEKTWTFPNGAVLLFGYLETEADAHRYWGQEFTFIGIDEAGHFKEPEPLDALRSRMRTTTPGVRLELVLTANPGGAGQEWLKERYITDRPPFVPFTDPASGLQRVYIPSWLTDNPYLMADKSYVQRIKASGPSWLVRALLVGDWNVSAAGKIFMPEWWHWHDSRDTTPWDRHPCLTDVLPTFRTIVQAWDTDFGKGNDMCAMVTLGVAGSKVYLLDWFEESLKYPALLREVSARAARWKPSVVIVEDKASGQSLLQSLELTNVPAIAGNKGSLNKEDHWIRNSGFVEAGRIALNSKDPRHNQFASNLQACGTPAEHRDLADAFSYALDYVREHYAFSLTEDTAELYTLSDLYGD